MGLFMLGWRMLFNVGLDGTWRNVGPKGIILTVDLVLDVLLMLLFLLIVMAEPIYYVSLHLVFLHQAIIYFSGSSVHLRFLSVQLRLFTEQLYLIEVQSIHFRVMILVEFIRQLIGFFFLQGLPLRLNSFHLVVLALQLFLSLPSLPLSLRLEELLSFAHDLFGAFVNRRLWVLLVEEVALRVGYSEMTHILQLIIHILFLFLKLFHISLIRTIQASILQILN